MTEHVPAGVRRAVVERAGACCEYCRYPQTASFLPFEIEHIIAPIAPITPIVAIAPIAAIAAIAPSPRHGVRRGEACAQHAHPADTVAVGRMLRPYLDGTDAIAAIVAHTAVSMLTPTVTHHTMARQETR